MKVLIVDDSVLIRDRLSALLTEIEGVEIVGEAQNRAEAAQAMRMFSPEVVILDLQLSGSSGFDVLRDIKQMQAASVVIMLTSFPHPQHRRKCLEAGADFFFDKSSEFERVKQLCNKLLRCPQFPRSHASYRHVMPCAEVDSAPAGAESRWESATIALIERERIEAALRESEERYRVIVENTFDLICELNQDAQYLYCSPNYRDVLGYEPEALLGRSAFDLIHPDDLPGVRVEFGKSSAQVAFRLRHKNGEWRWLESTGKAYYTARGEFRGVIVSRDITARKQAEEARQQETAISRALARVGGEIIASLDTQVILDRLCQLTTDELGCDCAHIILWQPRCGVYTTVAGYGDTLEQWETIRAVPMPPAAAASLLDRLEQQETIQAATAASQDFLPVVILQRTGVTTALWTPLRRGKELLGGLSAGYRGRTEPFTPQQERIALGIAHLASLALENARLLEEAERASRIKSDFLATVSHELRTPLHIIMGYTDLLLSGDFGPLTAAQDGPLRRIDKNARQLLELITDTLDVSRLEAGRLPLQVTKVDLPELLREIAAETRELLHEKPNLRGIWRVAPKLRLYTDRAKLKVIVKNLVHNAIKFTERGAITVTAEVCEGGAAIAVADTGIGIAPQALPEIFQMFRQGDNSMARSYDGLGLGLYIVKKMLELLGGTVTVESEVGRGSTFRVWAPDYTEAQRREKFPAQV